jgi:hypothetical protein
MWPWIKRWRDWVMPDLWPMQRTGLQPQALHYSYEKAGLILHDQPVPWSAEAVLVEACVSLGAAAPGRKNDFQLRVGRLEPLSPESMRREEGAGADRHRLFFRLAPPPESTTVELLYKSHVLGQLTLPVATRDQFIKNLKIQMPTLFVRLGEQSIACQTFVAAQCRGLLLSAVLASPTSLVPLLDLGLQVEIRSDRGGPRSVLPARLCSSQLAGRQALVTTVPRRFPRRIGNWIATWLLGDQPLATQPIRAISKKSFRRSLRISDTRFVVQSKKEPLRLSHHVPVLDGATRIGPCFLVTSREPGMAGLCEFQLRAQVPGSLHPPLLAEEELLVTDGPTMFAPGTFHTSDLGEMTGFELRLRNACLGVLSLSPAPAAAFNAEGGFKSPRDFAWSVSAEDELNDRLTRLLEGREEQR